MNPASTGAQEQPAQGAHGVGDIHVAVVVAVAAEKAVGRRSLATELHQVHLAAYFAGVDEPVAVLAELEPGLARRLGLDGELTSDVAVAEVSIDRLLEAQNEPSGYRPIPRFPGIKVDVAVLLPDVRPAGEVLEAIRRAGKGHVADVQLFDLYRSDSLGAGKKSLAYHVLLQSEQKTLSDQDGQKFLTRLERQLQPLEAELRKG